MNDTRDIESKKNLVTIIIATYNAQKHLEECLQSITAQSEKNIEIIIADGGSNDKTIGIVKLFAKNENITWKSEPDEGIYDAMNKGIEIATGRWLHFLGSDDSLLPGFSEMASKLKDEDTIYYGNTEPFYHGDKKPGYELLSGKFSKYRLAKYCVNHQAILYPAKVFQQYKYDLRYQVFADYALNIKLWGNKKFKKQFYPVSIARYNMTGFSSTVVDEQFKKDKPKIIRENMGWPIYIRFLLKRWKKKLKGEKGFE